MSINHVETDYLIIGAGTVGLAFADTLLSETDAHITIVDRRGKPGGHWNDAYAFVTLHQPSSFYGVNSMAVGPDSARRLVETGPLLAAKRPFDHRRLATHSRR